ncbi:MAG: LemA family protein [Armatimonadetes bacterium]|nr:LemA family protein [Armatimonadota bacterium]
MQVVANTIVRPFRALGGLVIWVIVLACFIAVSLLVFYNRLVSLRVRASNAWADIDVQLKRRHDLVPNLIAVVQGYAAHEKAIFEDVARYRAQALDATDPRETDTAESQLTSGIKSLFAIAENYPNLRADENFRKLQDQLAEVENNIQYARRYYNAVVRDYNTATELFPSRLVASAFGFKRLAYFQAEAEARGAVTFSLTDKQN